MKLIDDIEILYSIKKDNKPDEFKRFFDQWKDSLSLDNIPNIIKLYYGKAENPIQNEYVSQMLNSIYAKLLDKADEIDETIADNYRILYHEEEWDCLEIVFEILNKAKNPQEFLKRLYKIKKLNRPDEILGYNCKWKKCFTVDDIPGLVRLYYSDAETPCQNEFITETIANIIEKTPKQAIEKIIGNFDVLVEILAEEDSEDKICEFIRLLVWWNEEHISFAVKTLQKADDSIQEKFIAAMYENENSSFWEKEEMFLSLYHK